VGKDADHARGNGLTSLSDEQVEAIEAARARQERRAERREVSVEAALSALFVVAAFALWLGLPPADPQLGLAIWLGVVCAALILVEFEVGEGCTRPVQLALVPMLVLLPPAVVPLVVVAAHVAARLPEVLLRRVPAQRLLLAGGDSWFVIAPVLVVAVLADGPSPGALVIGVAVGAQVGVDFGISALRMWAAVGVGPRSQLQAYAWVYLVDLLLTPVGWLAAVAGAAEPLAVAAVLPLAGLLSVFARERRGRIENALALHRVAQEGRARLESIVQNSSDLIVILDAAGHISSLTGSVAPVFGDGWEAARGEAFVERVHPGDRAMVAHFLASAARKAPADSQEGEWRIRCADGSHRHIAAVATNLLDDPRVTGIVLTARDVDARKALEEQLRHRAFHDPLTGLANRALFYDRVEHALMRAAREDAQVAVLFIDLDDFKPINDRYGHAAGDRVLEEIGRRIESCVRSADTAARLGGDEFGVLLETVSGASAAIESAERLLGVLDQPLMTVDEPIRLSASIGLATSSAAERGIEELLRKGDLAMYAAKANGKARIELYEPDLERIEAPTANRANWFRGRDEQREEILSVLEDPGALAIAFQPIMDLRSGRVAGYEALARFQRSPSRPPNEWFAQAHRCGLGFALEAKALSGALTTPNRPDAVYLALNVSPSSLIHEELRSVLPARLDGLVIEITENELVSEDPAIARAIGALRERGARLAVDDVGAGYAGLTHVMRLAPDIIKLDRALTTGVDTDPVKAALVGSFVRYARDIHATVCAEGIETPGELARLADLDVAYGQGYGIARPAPPWPTASPEAAAACLLSFQATLEGRDEPFDVADRDRRFELLTSRLARASSRPELDAHLPALAAELNADEVRLDPGNGAQLTRQTLVNDSTATPDERLALRQAGYGARLTTPIHHGDMTVGTLELYSHDERPWSRFHISRARLIAHQLGLTLDRLEPPTPIDVDKAGPRDQDAHAAAESQAAIRS
jgi:diguanylate cyclase (GGDEF)-like protein/PAS domain S-box-containing protein